jgi:hypothetical protein
MFYSWLHQPSIAAHIPSCDETEMSSIFDAGSLNSSVSGVSHWSERSPGKVPGSLWVIIGDVVAAVSKESPIRAEGPGSIISLLPTPTPCAPWAVYEPRS